MLGTIGRDPCSSMNNASMRHIPGRFMISQIVCYNNLNHIRSSRANLKYTIMRNVGVIVGFIFPCHLVSEKLEVKS